MFPPQPKTHNYISSDLIDKTAFNVQGRKCPPKLSYPSDDKHVDRPSVSTPAKIFDNQNSMRARLHNSTTEPSTTTTKARCKPIAQIPLHASKPLGVFEIGVLYRFPNSRSVSAIAVHLFASGRSEWRRSDDVCGVYGVYALSLSLSLSPGFMVGDSLLVFIDGCGVFLGVGGR